MSHGLHGVAFEVWQHVPCCATCWRLPSLFSSTQALKGQLARPCRVKLRTGPVAQDPVPDDRIIRRGTVQCFDPLGCMVLDLTVMYFVWHAGTSRVMPTTTGSHQHTAMPWSWRHSGSGITQVRTF